MSEKQDRQQWRTPSQFESKYNLGKSFAEVMGLAEEARGLAEVAIETAKGVDANLDHEEIFNRLTKNGEIQGLYEENGNVYFNASYIKSGTLLADLVKAGVLQSKDGKSFYLDLDRGILKGSFSEFSITGKTGEEISNEQLVDFVNKTTKDIDELQDQIDGNITSWFYDYPPGPNKEPESLWTTDELKNDHIGDLFYVVDNEEYGGQVYRWVLVNGVYKWTLLEDSEVTKALEAAAKAQSTADGKMRVFFDTPSPPYDKGDLWTVNQDIGSIKKGDLYVCNVKRAEGESYSVGNDWIPATTYIKLEQATQEAERIATAKINTYAEEVTGSLGKLQHQLDGNVTTWYYDYVPSLKNAPANSWNEDDKNNHLGDLFYIIENKGAANANENVGQVYRWEQRNEEFGWYLYGDTKVAQALSDSRLAKDTADGKRRVFVAKPKPPYDEGDLWTVNQDIDVFQKGDLTVCVNTRKTGDYDESDWELATNYINSKIAADIAGSVAQDKINAQTSEEIFYRLSKGGTIQGLWIEDNKFYLSAECIQAVEKLFAKDIVMTGVFRNTSKAFLNPGKEECDRLYQLIKNSLETGQPIPSSYLAYYDFDDSGDITTEDLNIAYAAMRGDSWLYDNWGNGRETDVTLVIDMKNPEKAIRIYGTNVWGRFVDSYWGVNHTTVTNPQTEARLKALEDNSNKAEVGYAQEIGFDCDGVNLNGRLRRKDNITEMFLSGVCSSGDVGSEIGETSWLLNTNYYPDFAPLNAAGQPIDGSLPSCPLMGRSESIETMEIKTFGIVYLKKWDFGILINVSYDFTDLSPGDSWHLYASMTWIN